MKKFEPIVVGTLVVLVAFGLIAVGILPASTQRVGVDSGKLTNERMTQIKGGANPVPHCTEAPYDCPTVPAATCTKNSHEFEPTEGASACDATSVQISGDAGYRTCTMSTQLNGNDKYCGTEQTKYCAKKTVCVMQQTYGRIEYSVCKVDGASTKLCGNCSTGVTDNDPNSAKTHQVCD